MPLRGGFEVVSDSVQCQFFVRSAYLSVVMMSGDCLVLYCLRIVACSSCERTVCWVLGVEEWRKGEMKEDGRGYDASYCENSVIQLVYIRMVAYQRHVVVVWGLGRQGIGTMSAALFDGSSLSQW